MPCIWTLGIPEETSDRLLCCGLANFCLISFIISLIICREMIAAKYPLTQLALLLNDPAQNLNSLRWRHLVSAVGLLVAPGCRHRCIKSNVTFSPQTSSLSPSCHLSAWQHKVIASRCNQDDMLVTHPMHSVAYNVRGRHKIKPVHRWEDKMLLNIHQFFSDCCNAAIRWLGRVSGEQKDWTKWVGM